jgi:hypothetical protein
MAIVMVWLSVRGLRLATGVDSLEQPRVKAWRVFAGVFIFVVSLTTIFVPSFVPNSQKYQANTAGETVGQYIGWILFFWLAVWLIRSAFPRKLPVSTTVVKQRL